MLYFDGKDPTLVTKFCLHNFFHGPLQQNNLRPDACTSLLTTAGNIKWTKEEPAGLNAELRSIFKSSGARSVFFHPLGAKNVISAGMLCLVSLSPARVSQCSRRECCHEWRWCFSCAHCPVPSSAEWRTSCVGSYRRRRPGSLAGALGAARFVLDGPRCSLEGWVGFYALQKSAW